jgi:maleylpyruvate isomerase
MSNPSSSQTPSQTTLSQTTTQPLTLYTYWRSSSSYRCRIALAFFNLPYTSKYVHLVKGEQHNQEVNSAANKLSQVPTLQITNADGTKDTLTQSMAIINYLDKVYGTPTQTLSPPGMSEIALARSMEIAEIINSGIQPLQNFSTMKYLTSTSDGKIDGRSFGKDAIIKGLAAVESVIKEAYGGYDYYHKDRSWSIKYCTGSGPNHSLTIGDICIVPQLYNAARFDIDVKNMYPFLYNVGFWLMKLECVEEAKPEKQGDAVVVEPPNKKAKN